MLELDNVTTHVGKFRLEGVRLGVGEGESHVLIGPSGSGKTTLLEAVVGFRSLDAGQIRFFGRDLMRVPIEQRRIGYLPQRLALFPHLTVRDNITYGARARRLPVSGLQPVVTPLIEATGIGHLLDRRPDTLSGGERQRVALVRALAVQPHLLLLDEPFSALNETLRRELWWLLKTLQAEHRFATLMITHDLAEAFFLADHISVLIDGRVTQSSAKDTVWNRPATAAVANYLGIHNLFPCRVRGVEAGTVLVDCPQLRRQLGILLRSGDRPFAAGEAAAWGIRPEFVVLRDPCDPPKEDEVILDGRIAAITLTGADAIVLFRPENAEVALEARVSAPVLRRLGLTAGQAARVSLPQRDLFLTAS